MVYEQKIIQILFLNLLKILILNFFSLTNFLSITSLDQMTTSVSEYFSFPRNLLQNTGKRRGKPVLSETLGSITSALSLHMRNFLSLFILLNLVIAKQVKAKQISSDTALESSKMITYFLIYFRMNQNWLVKKEELDEFITMPS